jgi:hypothetical protein
MKNSIKKQIRKYLNIYLVFMLFWIAVFFVLEVNFVCSDKYWFVLFYILTAFGVMISYKFWRDECKS